MTEMIKKTAAKMGQREMILTVIGVAACTYLGANGGSDIVVGSIAAMTGAYSVSRGLAKTETK